MKALKIISFLNIYLSVVFFGASLGNINSYSSLDQNGKYATSHYTNLGITTQAHFGYLKLELSSSSSSYSTDFYFNSNASIGLDPGYDSAIFEGNLPDLAIYSYLVQNNDGTTFAIQSLSDADMQNVNIPLGINASQGEEVTISIFETDLPESIDIYLEDTLTNEVTLLNSNDYVFTPANDISGEGRFFINFQGESLNIEEPSLTDLIIAFNSKDKSIVIKGQLKSETIIKLFDLNGRMLIHESLNTTSTLQSIDVTSLSTDIYILELVSSTNERRTQKLIIR